jgi:DNA polymerase phi
MPPNFSNPRKRRREAANVDVKLVEIYEDLANEKNEIRLKAAADLLSRFTTPNSVSDEEVEKVLHRLFRGLCSSRKAARIGFSIALTELLSTILGSEADKARSSSIDVPKILHILETLTKPSGPANGQVRNGELSKTNVCVYTNCLTGGTGPLLWPSVWSGSHLQVRDSAPS